MGIIDIMAYKVESWSDYNIMIFTLVPFYGFHLFCIGEQKRHFCEAVNWLLCNSNQEGKFLFYAVMLVPTYRFPSHGFICLHCFLFAMLVSVHGFI